ncbi:MAG: hypothetical protein KIG88_02765 [Weeksellaceae bacterium]|nr:hypothetical protein [Weeksellaceae bacterium]
MKYIFYLIPILLIFSCSMDNKAYHLRMESLQKTENKYQLTVSTEVNLDEIKNKHQFTHQEFIGSLKNRDFKDKSIIIVGNFDTKNQKIIDKRFYYTVDLMITNRDEQLDLTNQLTEKDTISGFLQLSYDMGRTYPTKNIDLPARIFIEASK